MENFDPKQILCPIDFSEHSAAALRVAALFAKAFEASLLVLHAQRLEAPVYFTEAQTAALKTQLRRSARAALALTEDFSRKYLPPSLPRSVKVVEADAVTAILEGLNQSKAGLAVMGTHGRTGFVRFRLGSVTESVLRQTPAPLVTVGPQVKSLTALNAIKRVLCAVDYSDHSRQVLEHAAAVAKRTGAELVVAHVAGEPALKPTARELHQTLCDWVDPEVRSRCHVTEEVRRGHPAEQIVDVAKKNRASLIVIGNMPSQFFGSLLFGRTTEIITRTSPCPVLTVPGK
ncbi:MAG TPA: universal stress protein [Terriglobia bacterium]|nr:universal stress protein [Terriglobia bacterium]